MKNFYPGLPTYDLAEQIYDVAKEKSFTLATIQRAGVKATSGNLTKLRNEAILEHPIDKTQKTAPGAVRPRRRQHQHGPRTWVLTPTAIRAIAGYRGEPIPKGVPIA